MTIPPELRMAAELKIRRVEAILARALAAELTAELTLAATT